MSIFFSCFYKKSDRRHKKVFKHYNDLFPEIRAMVINEMETEDKCRFTRCSKLSNKEAKASKNYIYSLTFHADSYYGVDIWVMHGFSHHFFHVNKRFKLEFRFRRGKYMECLVERKRSIWKEQLAESTDLLIYAADYFKHLLELYQDKIKKLDIMGCELYYNRLKDYDFGIRNLKNLEELGIEGDMDVTQYLKKLRGPLKSLDFKNTVDTTTNVAGCEEIYQVTGSLSMMFTNFTYEQMLRLNASDVYIPFGDITEMQICDFIQSWQNGTLGKELRHYQWRKTTNQNFNIPKLLQLLRLSFNVNTRGIIVIQLENYKDAGKRATLQTSLNYNQLSFSVFKHYNELFPEIRTMVINEMKTEDRCRFTRCSKLSNKEAKASKDYIYSLEFHAIDNSPTIYVVYENMYFYRFEDSGYHLEFREDSGRKCMKYESGNGSKRWEQELDGSTDLSIYAADYFKQLLGLYQNQIKHLRFTISLAETKLGNYDFGIKSLNRLQRLEVHGDMDVLQYFSRLRGPLEYLKVSCGKHSRLLPNCDEIYQVKDQLIMYRINLTFQQMLQLSASRVIIPFGNITVMEIFKFIRSWQLLRLLGRVRKVSTKYGRMFEIEHYEESRRKATLYTNTDYDFLSFDMMR